MSNDLRAAAERLRRINDESYSDVYGVDYTGGGMMERDCKRLEDFALGLLDSTPVDETWLRSEFGPLEEDRFCSISVRPGVSLRLFKDGVVVLFTRGGIGSVALTTRGAVRSLLHALQGATA
jgi:hypothetical protein